MLNLAATRIVKSLNREVATGTEVKAEGLALVYVNESGIGKVKPSSGAPGERFAGVSQSQTLVPTQTASVENLKAVDKAGAPVAELTLHYLNIVAGQIRVCELNNDGKEVAAYTLVAGAPAANEFSLLGNVVTLNAASAGKSFNVYYRYLPLASEAIDLYGVGPVGGVSASAFTNSVGLITEGDISTDAFDATDDWASFVPGTDKIYLGNFGIFTMTAGGTELANANLVTAPHVGGAFLTLNLA